MLHEVFKVAESLFDTLHGPDGFHLGIVNDFLVHGSFLLSLLLAVDGVPHLDEAEVRLELLTAPLGDEGLLVLFDGLPHLLELTESLPFLDSELFDEDGLMLIEWHWLVVFLHESHLLLNGEGWLRKFIGWFKTGLGCHDNGAQECNCSEFHIFLIFLK